MGWGKFKKKVGLNKLHTRKAAAKVEKFAPMVSMVPGVGTIASLAIKGAIKAGAKGYRKEEAKTAQRQYAAAEAAYNQEQAKLVAPLPMQVDTGDTWQTLSGVADNSGALTLPPRLSETERAEGISKTNKLALIGMVGVLAVALIAKGLRK